MRRGEQLRIRVQYSLNWRGIIAFARIDSRWKKTLSLEVYGEILVDVGQILLDLAAHFAKVLAQVVLVLILGVLLLLLLQMALKFLVQLSLLHGGYQALGRA